MDNAVIRRPRAEKPNAPKNWRKILFVWKIILRMACKVTKSSDCLLSHVPLFIVYFISIFPYLWYCASVVSREAFLCLVCLPFGSALGTVGHWRVATNTMPVAAILSQRSLVPSLYTDFIHFIHFYAFITSFEWENNFSALDAFWFGFIGF